MNDKYRTYTHTELAMRNGLLSAEVWVAYRGLIYDVSASELFKNGKHYRLACGRDLTEEMDKAPHFEDVLEKFPVVGVLGD